VLALNFLLIPRYGMFGAAWATLIAYVYKAASTYFFSNRFFRIHFEFLRMAKIFLAAAGIFVVAGRVNFPSVYADVAVRTLLVMLFPAVLYLMHFFTPGEKERFVSIFRPQEDAAGPLE
jgi:O-antigen/teichoic acid export membrane protein